MNSLVRPPRQYKTPFQQPPAPTVTPTPPHPKDPSPQKQRQTVRQQADFQHALFAARHRWILGIFATMGFLLLSRAVYLQVLHKDFLQTQGEARFVRSVPVVAHRGILMDRNNEPLAVSTPVMSVWMNPGQFVAARPHWQTVANTLGLSVDDIETLVRTRNQREFVYLKRHISPNLAEHVRELNLPGIFLQQEYGRFYPTGEIAAHVVGFTNVDDKGQEGLELALDTALAGVTGAKQIIQDKNGQVIADVEGVHPPESGKDIRLSIDRRLQYLTYRELKQAVSTHKAESGSAILLDVHTGEVLAMVNQPSFNPNNREERQPARYRNRAITDVFEPGSTMKPFTIAAALESGQFTPRSRINTRPGSLQVGKYTVHDSRNYGIIDVTTVIQKSSNVGASKIALALPKETLWRMLSQLGFGRSSGCGFPGEAEGRLPHFDTWQMAEQASISYGYGLNVSLLQLVRAYAALGNQGVLPPIRLIAVDDDSPAQSSFPVMSPEVARQVLTMLESVVNSGGTAEQAQVKGFRIAGKTGTVRKSSGDGYSMGDYLSVFAGLAPASAPRLALAVVIQEPRAGGFYGGEVAAPVFSKIMGGALRLWNVPPDAR